MDDHAVSIGPFADALPDRLTPTDEPAAQAWQLLSRGRLLPADRVIATLPDTEPADRAWRALLLARRAWHDRQSQEAMDLLRSASAWALEACGAATVDADPAPPARLAALCLQEMGAVCVRTDEPNRAEHVLQAAHALRCQRGTASERWQTALHLALCAQLQNRPDDACVWLQRSVAHAEAIDPPWLPALATSQDRLSSVLVRLQRFDEAVSAARLARRTWDAHDPGSLAVPRADLQLAWVLLQQAEAAFDAAPETAGLAVADARELLADADQGLRAFGVAGRADLPRCEELREFAERLQQALMLER